MIKRVATPNIIRRLCHTHSKTFFSDNNYNKNVIEDLIKQHNKNLQDISESINYLGLSIGLVAGVIAWKPMK